MKNISNMDLPFIYSITDEEIQCEYPVYIGIYNGLEVKADRERTVTVMFAYIKDKRYLIAEDHFPIDDIEVWRYRHISNLKEELDNIEKSQQNLQLIHDIISNI